jgi:flavin reductase (DIM6/NTAB) family NADH-FMN oxidoreductase RutF
LGHGEDEFAIAGVTKETLVLVRPPRVKESPVHLECPVEDIITLHGEMNGVPNYMIAGPNG